MRLPPSVWRDEGNALRTVGPVTKCGALVYLIKKSPLMTWFLDDCYNTRKEKNLKHFVVMCANDVIDIITADDDVNVELG